MTHAAPPLSQDQEAALAKMAAWCADPMADQFFRLYGGAGTGKTTMLDTFLRRHGLTPLRPRLGTKPEDKDYVGDTLVAAPTGKAAQIVADRLSDFKAQDGRTLHSLFKAPIPIMDSAATAANEKLDALNRRIAQAREAGNTAQAHALMEERGDLVDVVRRGTVTQWDDNPDPDSRHAKVLIVDEASMVGMAMKPNLDKCGCKILAVGDPFQLPPPKDVPGITNVPPDAELTTVHRFAAGGMIAMLGQHLRSGNWFNKEVKTDEVVVTRDTFDVKRVMGADILLVWRNATRMRLNRDIRARLGFKGTFARDPNERLICIKNNHELGIMNGTRVRLIDSVVYRGELQADVQPLFDDGRPMGPVVAGVPIWTGDMERHYDKGADDIAERIPPGHLALTYSWVVTCHKAQGSEYQKVALFAEDGLRAVMGREALRWAYTGVTRAKERLVVFA